MVHARQFSSLPHTVGRQKVRKVNKAVSQYGRTVFCPAGKHTNIHMSQEDGQTFEKQKRIYQIESRMFLKRKKMIAGRRKERQDGLQPGICIHSQAG